MNQPLDIENDPLFSNNICEPSTKGLKTVENIRKDKVQNQIDIDLFQSLLGERLLPLQNIGRKITEIEQSICNVNVEELGVGKRVKLYKILVSSHIAYIKTIKDVLSQIDLDEVMKVFGLVALTKKVQNIPKDSIKRISDALDSLKSEEEINR